MTLEYPLPREILFDPNSDCHVSSLVVTRWRVESTIEKGPVINYRERGGGEGGGGVFKMGGTGFNPTKQGIYFSQPARGRRTKRRFYPC